MRQKTLAELAIEIEAKHKERKEVEEEIDHRRKRARIDADNDLAKYKRDKALEILLERGEVPVEKSVFEELKAECAKMRETLETRVEAAQTKADEDAKERLRQAVSVKDLQHKAEVAKMQAEIEQGGHKVRTLETQIENLREELAE